jgi:hypothetical protein
MVVRRGVQQGSYFDNCTARERMQEALGPVAVV